MNTFCPLRRSCMQFGESPQCVRAKAFQQTECIMGHSPAYVVDVADVSVCTSNVLLSFVHRLVNHGAAWLAQKALCSRGLRSADITCPPGDTAPRTKLCGASLYFIGRDKHLPLALPPLHWPLRADVRCTPTRIATMHHQWTSVIF
jgi:hypothetical protein